MDLLIYSCCFPFSLSLFQPSLTQMEIPVAGLTVDGVDSVCWWRTPAVPSVFARKSAGPPSCRCVVQTAGSTRTTARFTAPPAWRGGGSTWCTARTASSKVALHCHTDILTLQWATATRCKKWCEENTNITNPVIYYTFHYLFNTNILKYNYFSRFMRKCCKKLLHLIDGKINIDSEYDS